MGVEASIYSRLNDSSITTYTSDRITPTDPEQGTDWPFVVYTVQGTQPVTSMAGSTPLTLYSVEVDVWTRSVSQQAALLDAIRSRLHCYRGGTIQRSALTAQDSEKLGDEQEGAIYHATQSYDVWATA